MNDDNIQPQQPTTLSGKERVIQPSASFIQEVQSQNQEIAAQPQTSPVNNNQQSVSAVYPEPIRSYDQNRLSASQQFAVSSSQMRANESNRPVSLQVKSVMVVAFIGVLSSLYGFYLSFNVPNAGVFGTIMAFISFIQLGMSLYLFFGKDHNTAALILKIYLVFQLISLFLSLLDPVALIINGAIAFFMFYVYTRVKSLTYY